MKLLLFLLLLTTTIFCTNIKWEPCPPVFLQASKDAPTQIVEHLHQRFQRKFPDPIDLWAPMDTELLNQVPQPECAYIDVPLDWDCPSGPKIKYFIRRFRALPDRKKGQLWMQQGGPGGSGTVFLTYGPNVWLQMNGTLDIIAPDHRGTGWSTSMDCPQYDELDDPEEKAWKECALFVKKTQKDLKSVITVTQAVKDMHYTVNLLHQPGMKKYFYGVSYGAYFMNRYLQLYPGEPDGVIFDSTCPPKVCRLIDFYDKESDIAGKKFLEKCKSDSFCKKRLPDPEYVLKEVFSKVRNGSRCATFKRLNTETFGLILYTLVTSDQARAIIPALLNRIYRCNAVDERALIQFYSYMFGGSTSTMLEPFREANLLTNANIVLSELHTAKKTLPSRKEMEQYEDKNYHFRPGTSIYFRGLLNTWEGYKPDRYWDNYHRSCAPYVILQGELDPQTPYWMGSQQYKNTARNKSQKLVGFPNAVHGIISYACGLDIIQQFLENPKGGLNLKCTENMPKIDFAGENALTKAISNLLFGTPDLWG